MAEFWLQSVTPVAPPKSANPTIRALVYAGVVTGSWSGLLCLAVYGIGRACGVPFVMNDALTGALSVVPWLLVLLAPLAFAIVGALLCTLMLQRPHAGRIAFWAGSIIALLSLASPLHGSGEALWSSRIWLALLHLITWFLVVPQLARIVGDSEPGASVDRE